MRMRGAYMQLDYDDTWSDVEGKIEYDGSNAGLILDYHPFGGVFRISAGLNYSKMCLNAKGTMEHNLAGEYDFGGYQFKVEGKDFFKIADDIFVYPFIQLGMGYRF